jgi:integrase
VSRSVASFVKPPKVDETEIESLKADEMDTVLTALKDHWLERCYGACSGARRGELLALNWANVDLDAGTIKIERSLEQTKAGLRYKAPKTKNGRRVVSLPPIAVDALRAHRRRQLELRMVLGQGRPEPDTLIFCTHEGDPIPPNKLVPRLGPVREGEQTTGDFLSRSAAQSCLGPNCRRRGCLDSEPQDRPCIARCNDEGLCPPVLGNR